jgi:predicted esterase
LNAACYNESVSDAIKIVCPHCRKVSRIPASYGGRRGRCPGCREAIEVPKAVPDGLDKETVEVPAPKIPTAAAGTTKRKIAHGVIAVLVIAILWVLAAPTLREAFSPLTTVHVSGAPGVSYVLRLPDDYSPENSYPLMLCLHPYGNGLLYLSRVETLANSRGVIVAASNNFANNIDSNVFAPQLQATLDHLTGTYSVDLDRIYLAGFSGGGMGCYVSAHCVEGYAYAGLIVNSGVLHPFMAKDPTEIKAMRAKRVVILGGDHDELNPPAVLAKDRELLEGQGLEVHMLSYPGGHESAPTSIYEEALDILEGSP